MSRKTFDVQGGQAYNAPAVEIVEIEVEQPVFQGSGTLGIKDWVYDPDSEDPNDGLGF